MTDIILKQLSLVPRIKNAYEHFLKEGDSMSTSSCKVRLSSLQNTFLKFETNHSLLLTSPDIETIRTQPYFKEELFEATEETYIQVSSLFQKYLDEHPPPPAHVLLDSTHFNETLHNINDNNNNTGNSYDCERLPRIALPEFDGEFKNWEAFRDVFVTAVVNREKLSDVYKLSYLRSHVKGDAWNLVNSFSLTEKNFNIVWKKLTDRYENKKRLINAHLSSIFSIKPMNDYTSKELKRILDSLNTPLSSLKVLQRPVETWDDFLVFHGVSLLHSDAKIHFETFVNNLNLQSLVNTTPTPPTLAQAANTTVERNSEPTTFAIFIQFLENQINMMELIENYDGSCMLSNQPKQKNQNVSTQPAKVCHTQVEQKPSGASNKTECLICKNNHHFAQCPTFKSKSIPQRIEFFKSKKRCFNCLGNHFSNKCTSEKRCTICNNKHNSTLHIVNYKKSQNSSQGHQNNATLNANVQNGRQQSSLTETDGPSNS